ncbi:hypothetical protein [Massilia timonae]|uniref:hypothetical protein n=1 Tax=Massilia timonae TaxID=47229 RepID=UPI0028D28ACC|nr:hypothetical protein [Massilia timonae]
MSDRAAIKNDRADRVVQNMVGLERRRNRGLDAVFFCPLQIIARLSHWHITHATAGG